ncbi:hypothetical protein HMPREF0043_00968 [Actinobaculum sp. oral taxon 183 str. F0552]|nr:hypothetical protein HMPREF0043_00968 [Actinobaculum sp. oral taxon 183 str. F0552]
MHPAVLQQDAHSSRLTPNFIIASPIGRCLSHRLASASLWHYSRGGEIPGFIAFNHTIER